MTGDDVPEAERLSDEAFTPLAEPGMSTNRSPEAQAMWRVRADHLLATDPAGCWVAERDGTMLGFATSFRRDLTWFLATYAVRPDLQGAGLGRALLEAALTHARGCLRGMLSASRDPRAFRRYRHAGFTLHPQMVLHGRVDRSTLPVVDEHLREGTETDFDLLDSLDRQRRDAAHGADHAVLLAQNRLVVVDRASGSGYAYIAGDGKPAVICASSRRVAASLLWEAVASAPEELVVPHVTAANEWAIDVGLAAGLSVDTSGYLAVRGMKPPAPYVHHGALL
ncbi:GNAT family N-acetyltransferase [Nocardioides pocheonensis]|uniref:GNAT family N-acetyltransferase n=2 Tax=Nocardioides pocheonensis TaxID=661485 RepID=A0A3N0GQI4_9ACTN|nr:GNAT family N-acetyltransferase [Nocardioides pocheonensis]